MVQPRANLSSTGSLLGVRFNAVMYNHSKFAGTCVGARRPVCIHVEWCPRPAYVSRKVELMDTNALELILQVLPTTVVNIKHRVKDR